MNAYQKEQLQALMMVREHLISMDEIVRDQLSIHIGPYLDFRHALEFFTQQR